MSSGDRRTALVDSALRVISRDGVHAATTRTIVAEADMSLASFHYAFRSRDEMIRELIDAVLEAQSAAALSSLVDAADIRSAIRGALQSFFDIVRADPHHEQAMFELFHYALRTPELDDLPRQQYAGYHETVAALLAAGADALGVEWTRPIADIARFVVTVTDGVTLAWLADSDAAAAGRTLDFAAEFLAALARPALASPAVPAAAPFAASPLITKEHTP
ncbi:MAG: TetR family transcriptional regulator [Glaciihabitans sp.]|nr:TetR family transcriptional regulator [Glaciihabitans sp.]